MPKRQRADTDRGPEFSSEGQHRGLFGKPTLFVFWLFIVVVCAALIIPAVPQYRLLSKIEAELKDAKQTEQRLRETRDQLHDESRALKKNPRYLEARARDPLRVQLEGETVIEIKN
jgi:cell division protein FtsB